MVNPRDKLRAFRQRNRLSMRLLWSILLFSSVITLIGTGIQLYLDYQRDLSDVDKQIDNVQVGHLESLTTSFWKIDTNQIQTELKNMVKMRDVLSLTIYTDDWVEYRAGENPKADEDVRIHRFPMMYDDDGVIPLKPARVSHANALFPGILGTTLPMDPFRVRVETDSVIEEKDFSKALIEEIRKRGIDGVISVLGPQELGTAWKLSRKGVPLAVIPKALENDVAGTALSFGFNSALSYVVDTLERARTAAKTLGRIAVVEVPGIHAGWLALQGGIAAMADAILIPEIPYHMDLVTARIRKTSEGGWPVGLVVVSAGASPAPGEPDRPDRPAHAMDRTGFVAEQVALALQRRMKRETFSLAPGKLIGGGNPTAVDRQLGAGYGAAAVRAVSEGRTGIMTAFDPPDLTFVPLADAVNRFRTVPLDSEFVQVARSLGISLGD